MYTPKIHESLIPCIYHAAQERKVPMTKLTDAFVYKGLRSEPFGLEVSTRLPEQSEIILPSLLVAKDGTNRAIYHTNDPAAPFRSISQLNAWYQSAHNGLREAHLSADPSNLISAQAQVAIEHLQQAYIAATRLLRVAQDSKEVQANEIRSA